MEKIAKAVIAAIKGKNRVYCFLTLCLVVLLVLCMVSMILSSWPATAPEIRELTRALEIRFPPQALGSLTGTVGVTGIVFGWLVARGEEQTCGVRVAELVEWSYPWFYVLYFTLFIPSALAGVMAGAAGWVWPAFYAAMEVLIHVAFLVRVCWVFVIRFDLREDRAFAFHKENIEKACREGTENQEESIRSAILKAADHTQSLIRQEYRPQNCDRLLQLWSISLVKLKVSREAELAKATGEIPLGYGDQRNQEVELAKATWEILLGSGDQRSREETAGPMFEALGRTNWKTEDRLPFLLGFVLALATVNGWSAEDTVEECLWLLLRCWEQNQAEELALLLAMIFLVRQVMDNPKHMSLTTATLRKQLAPLLDRAYQREAAELEAILRQGEQAACWALKVNPRKYIVRLSGRTLVLNGKNSPYDPEKQTCRADFLAWMLMET